MVQHDREDAESTQALHVAQAGTAEGVRGYRPGDPLAHVRSAALSLDGRARRAGRMSLLSSSLRIVHLSGVTGRLSAAVPRHAYPTT